MFDFISFYKNYNVDVTRLKRDYEKNPLQKILVEKKYSAKAHQYYKIFRYEIPYKSDIEYLYLDINVTRADLIGYLNINLENFKKILKELDIKKSAKLSIINTQKYYLKDPYKRLKVIEKRKKTCLEKYGGNAPAVSEEVKFKMKQTNLKLYKVEYALQNKTFMNKMIETTLDRFGTTNVSKCEKIKQKKKQTTLEHYGVENPFQSEKCKNKIKETVYNRYGTFNPMQNKDIVNKGWETKKRNNTTNSSKIENYIYEKLKLLFSNIKRQYKSEKYPFACDFYIPELDLYIEYQGHCSHGKEPFDLNNLKHLDILRIWQDRVNKKKIEGKKQIQYLSYIDVWTRRDPLKRKIVKENNLNWIEFFTFEEFINWFNSLKKEKDNE